MASCKTKRTIQVASGGIISTMDTKNKLQVALVEAMKSNDKVAKTTIRLAMAAIKNWEIDKKSTITEQSVLTILQKELKIRREAIEGAEQANRADLISEAEAEINILKAFLPAPLTNDELDTLVRETINEVGAREPKEMGKVMKLLMPRIQGRADGKHTSGLVHKYLQSK
jgi:uncharacterized protein YqeY